MNAQARHEPLSGEGLFKPTRLGRLRGRKPLPHETPAHIQLQREIDNLRRAHNDATSRVLRGWIVEGIKLRQDEMRRVARFAKAVA